MSTSPENRDEEQLASLLRAAAHDAAPPDRALLDRLRDQSTAAFVSSSSQATIHRKKGRLMFQMVRGLAAAVAAAILILGGVHYWKSRTRTLGDVLDVTQQADTLQFRFVVNGTAWYDFWAGPDEQYRMEPRGGSLP